MNKTILEEACEVILIQVCCSRPGISEVYVSGGRLNVVYLFDLSVCVKVYGRTEPPLCIINSSWRGLLRARSSSYAKEDSPIPVLIAGRFKKRLLLP